MFRVKRKGAVGVFSIRQLKRQLFCLERSTNFLFKKKKQGCTVGKIKRSLHPPMNPEKRSSFEWLYSRCVIKSSQDYVSSNVIWCETSWLHFKCFLICNIKKAQCSEISAVYRPLAIYSNGTLTQFWQIREESALSLPSTHLHSSDYEVAITGTSMRWWG